MTESQSQFFRLADGVLAAQTVTGTSLPDLPEGATLITQEEYEEGLKALQAERDEYRARLDTEDQERMQDDYDALRKLGVPEGTARRLTGYAEGSE